MSVDISALRRFEETFGPAIAAIPAVIDAVSKTNDLERHITMKTQELGKVMAEIEEAKAQAQTFITQQQQRGDEIIKTADARAKAILADAQTERDNIKQSLEVLNDQINKAHEAVFVANQKRREVEEVAKEKAAELTAAHAAKVKQLESEIEELEARKAKADKALATLKAKLEA